METEQNEQRDGDAPSFSILMVCTGNICRSPIAEMYLKDKLAGIPGVSIVSAGTEAMPGLQMPQQALQHLEDLGVPPVAHSSQELSAEMLTSAHLILTMTMAHRLAVIEMAPSAMRKTFTLREFARILSAMEASEEGSPEISQAKTPDSLVRAATEFRGSLEPPATESDYEVIDPFRTNDQVWKKSLEQMIPALDVVGNRLQNVFQRA
jgi:protein-tyrosine phosphatase